MGAVRDYRLKEGRKLREVAEHCGVDIRTVTLWEKKDRVPKLKNALAVSEFLNVPVERLT